MAAEGGGVWSRGLGAWNDGSRLSRPHGLCCVGDYVYICDTENHFVRRTNATFLDTLETVAGIGRSVWGRNEGGALATTVSEPFAMFAGANNTLYITSSLESTLMELRRGKIAIKAGISGGAFKDGHVSVATLDEPTGGCVDPDTGVIYVVDGGNCRIRKISRLDVVSSIGTGEMATRDGPFARCAFTFPFAICLGREDTFYVSEHSAIRLLDARRGAVKTITGHAGAGFNDGDLHLAKFRGLKELAFQDGLIFVSDNGNDRIRRIDLAKEKVTTLVGPLSSTPPVAFTVPRGQSPFSSLEGGLLIAKPSSAASSSAGPKQANTNGTNTVRRLPPDDKKSRSAPVGLCLTQRGDLVFTQPKLNQLGIVRNVVEPATQTKLKPKSGISANSPSTSISDPEIDLRDASELDHIAVHHPMSLLELKTFELVGAGSLASSVLPTFHPAILELLFPSLLNLTYSTRLVTLLEAAEITIEEMQEFLYTEQLPASWNGVKLLNAICIAKKVHLPAMAIEVLLSLLHSYLYECKYEELFVLLSHVETHCKRSKELASMLASFVVLHQRIGKQTKDPTTRHLPEHISVWMLENIGAEKAKPPGVFRVERLHHDSYIRSRCHQLYFHLLEQQQQQQQQQNHRSISPNGAKKGSKAAKASSAASSSAHHHHSSSSSSNSHHHHHHHHHHHGSSNGGNGHTGSPSLTSSGGAGDSTSQIPSSPHLETNFTLISCDGQELFMCHDWILYARWPYFRHLVSSGATEWSVDRCLKFPPGTLHGRTIQAFLQYLYTNAVDAFYFDEEIATELLRHAQLFNLLTLSNPPEPAFGLDALIAACKSTFNRLCTLENCIDKYKLVTEFGSETYKFRVAAFIAENLPRLLQNETTASQLLSLGAATLGNIWIWTHGGPPSVDDTLVPPVSLQEQENSSPEV